MCIILLAYRVHAQFPLIFAANRDEFYARPSARARFWEDAPRVLAGRDLERGGTWLGVTTSGRIAAVTNYREPQAYREDAPSRGHLVSRFLEGDEPVELYLSQLDERASDYNGFNLIAGDARELYYYSNRGDGPQRLTPGVHGLSNHLLDTPWPKVTRGREALAAAVATNSIPSTEALFEVLANDARAVDALLPATGVGLELERALSPLFITTGSYGTRSSTVVLFDREGETTFIERTFTPERDGHRDVSYKFQTRSET